jgi:hypothetical protein
MRYFLIISKTVWLTEMCIEYKMRFTFHYSLLSKRFVWRWRQYVLPISTYMSTQRYIPEDLNSSQTVLIPMTHTQLPNNSERYPNVSTQFAHKYEYLYVCDTDCTAVIKDFHQRLVCSESILLYSLLSAAQCYFYLSSHPLTPPPFTPARRLTRRLSDLPRINQQSSQ